MASKPAELSGTGNKMDQAEQNRPITIRRVPFTDHTQLPADYSATPGGTLFSTTPGGTRIIYDREFLLQFRNSPLARNPPPNLPNIPGVTTQPDVSAENENPDIEEIENIVEKTVVKENEVDPQFAIDL